MKDKKTELERYDDRVLDRKRNKVDPLMSGYVSTKFLLLRTFMLRVWEKKAK